MLIEHGSHFDSFGDLLLELWVIKKLTKCHQKSIITSQAGGQAGGKGGVKPPSWGRRFGRKEERKKGRFEDLKKGLHALTRRVGG